MRLLAGVQAWCPLCGQRVWFEWRVEGVKREGERVLVASVSNRDARTEHRCGDQDDSEAEPQDAWP